MCLLEAGGAVYEAESQRLFEGEVVAGQYPMLRDTRVGAFGGSTNVWAGWCRPLEPVDFEPRGWCDAGGWPFGFDELRPYYARAHEICGLAAFDYEPERWAGILGSHRHTTPGIPHSPTRSFRSRPRTSAIAIASDSSDRRTSTWCCTHRSRESVWSAGPARRYEIRTLDGHDLAIRADRFVLAAGGVENPRLLLLSGSRPGGARQCAMDSSAAISADHSYVDPGTLVLREPQSLGFYRLRRSPQAGGRARSGASSALRRDVSRARAPHEWGLLLPPPIRIPPVFATTEVKAVLQLWNKCKQRNVPGAAGPYAGGPSGRPHRLAVAMARKLALDTGRRTLANACGVRDGFRYENRVMLSDERDRLGRRGPGRVAVGDTDIEKCAA